MTKDDNPRGQITLTSDAAEQIESMLHSQGFDSETAGLRVSVERGGCAGLSYQFDLTDDPAVDDVICETNHITVFVDRPSQQYLNGSKVAIEDTAHGTGLSIDNPNADQQCGCGLSFQ